MNIIKSNIFKKALITFPVWGILLYLIFGFELPKVYKNYRLKPVNKSFADSNIVSTDKFLKSIQTYYSLPENRNIAEGFVIRKSKFYPDDSIFEIEFKQGKNYETLKTTALPPGKKFIYNFNEINGEFKLYFYLPKFQMDQVDKLQILINGKKRNPVSEYDIQGFIEYKIKFSGGQIKLNVIQIENTGSDILYFSKPSLTKKVNRPPRQIFWFVIDAMRQDIFSGQFDILIPALRRFADENTRFPNAVTAANWTRPSTLSYLTGMNTKNISKTYMSHKHVAVNQEMQDFFMSNIPVTAPVLLACHGFEPVAIVNNAFITYASVSYEIGFPLKIQCRHDGEDKYVLYAAFMKFVKHHPNHDLFIFYNSNTCHSRYRTDAVNYLKALYSLPLAAPSSRELCFGTAGVADRMMRHIFDGLKKMGIYNSSKMIFHSDHGEFLITESYYYKDNKKPRFERHGKYMMPQAFRVPLILKGFDIKEDDKTLISLIDILPTIADDLGCGNFSFDGHSLLKKYPDRWYYITGDTQFGIFKQDKYYDAIGDRVMKFTNEVYKPVNITYLEKDFLNFGRLEYVKNSLFINKLFFIDKEVEAEFLSSVDTVGNLKSNQLYYEIYAVNEFPLKVRIKADYLYSQKFAAKIYPKVFLNFTIEDFIKYKQEEDLQLDEKNSFYTSIDIIESFKEAAGVKISEEFKNQLREWGYIQ
jgi:hypothetical protein